MKYLSKILFSLFILAALSFTSCDKDKDTELSEEITVEFKVTNSETGRTVDIEYTAETGSDVDLKDETLPWHETYIRKRELGDVLKLTVHGEDREGKMTAEILVNGLVVESETDDELIVLVWSAN